MKNPAIIEEIGGIEDMRLGEITDNEKSTKKEINILKDSIVDNFYQVEGIGKFNNRSFIFDNGVEGKDEKGKYITIDGEKYYKYKEGINDKGYQYYISEDNIACLYIGDFVEGEMGGKGIQFMDNGNKFEGIWKNGEPVKGILTYADGDKYEGDFKNHYICGRGIYTYLNGDKYEGDFVNNGFEGKGKYTFVNGDKYEGDFKNGTYNGEGTLTWENSGEILKGEWKNGKCVSGKITLNPGNRIFDVTEDEKGLKIITPGEYEGKYTKEII